MDGTRTDTLRAEQPSSSAPGAVKAPDESWVGWTGGDEPKASRQMTPNEIREDELKSVAERIGMLPNDEFFGEGVRRIIAGRIDALHPEQRQPGDPNESSFPFGLPYQQDATTGLRVQPDQTVILHGRRLDVDLTIPAGTHAYEIPPYQMDQLRAIADGRASWPDVSAADKTSPEEGTPEPENGQRWASQLGELTERLMAETQDLKAAEEARVTLRASELALTLLQGDHKGLLDRESAQLLARALVGGLASILVSE